MSYSLRSAGILCLCIIIFTGCTKKNTSVQGVPDIDTHISTIQESLTQNHTPPPTEQIGPTLLKQQKLQEDLMRSSSQCSEIKMSEELKKYLNSGTISTEQKKNLEDNFNLSVERCKIRAAVRENIDCTLLEDLSTKCENAKSAAKFIMEYESKKTTYQEYFGDPTVVDPKEVFKK